MCETKCLLFLNSSAAVPRSAEMWYSTLTSETDVHQPSANKEELDDEFDDFLGGRPELQLQGVDPRRGWGFRGVHKVLRVVTLNFIFFVLHTSVMEFCLNSV